MVRIPGVLMIGGALVVVPLGMGGIPLVKLLFFALAVLCGTGLHSPACRQAGLPRQIRTVSVCAPCSSVPHGIALRLSRMVQGLLFVFFAVVFLSPLWSVAPFLSVVGVEPRFEGVVAYVVFFGLALFAGSMVRMGREQDLLRVISWSNVGVVLYGLLQVVRMDPFGGWWDADVFLGRVFSTVGQPNFLGQFLLLTAPFAILAAWRWRENPLSHRERAVPCSHLCTTAVGVRGYSCITMLLLAGNLLVLFATGSRAGIVGLSAGLLFLLYVVRIIPSPVPPLPLRKGGGVGGEGAGGAPLPRPLSHCGRRGGKWMVATIFFVLGVILFLHRFTIPGEWDRSIGSHVAIWRDAVSMIRARPIGWGLETTGLLFPRFQHAPLTAYESLTANIDRAHSKPLDLLLTVGPLGLVTYYAFLVLLISGCIRAWRRDQDSSALVGALGLIGVSTSLLFGFEGIVVHAFFWLICGMLLGGRTPSPSGGGQAMSFANDIAGRGGQGILLSPLPCRSGGGVGGEGITRFAASVMSIFLFIIALFLVLTLSARLTMNRAEGAFQSGDLIAAVQGYDRAVRRAPWDQAILTRFLETALLAREQAENRETEQVLDVALEKRFRSLRWLTHDRDPLLPSLQAWHAVLREEKQDARTFLEEAETRAPSSVPRLRIATHVAQLLSDQMLQEVVRAELKSLLPPWWDDFTDPRHRILLKENPWVEDFLP